MLKKKSPKPIEYDINIKYQCPQCQEDHWLSYQEASTKGFKTVCYCNYVFKVKCPIGFSLEYSPLKPIDTSDTIQEPPIDIFNKSISLLVSYGFTQSEAKDLLIKSYSANPVDDYSLLVKQTLESIKN